ncbi:MAG TPA: polyphosphate kinase 2 family protein [Gaiellales bacterium]|jgi:PPK2 family polyphosphate:nucleotide phosphotransferase|nr:polyphosphate kinase 2 family protein [Gaiellales bacterium]
MQDQDLAQATRVAPGSKVNLKDHPPDARLGLRDEKTARERTAKRAERMAELAAMLMAEHQRAVLVVLQGMDASGKDGTIKHCLGGLNPMSVRVAGFKAPNSAELAHDFLWRVHQVVPQRGEIGIFNRSHYEDVLVVRVENLVPKQVWKQRYGSINNFEQHLANEGTTVVKLFLHISEEEQAKRFRARIADPAKNWKFSPDDLAKRANWNEYMTAYRAVLERTSTSTAPWHIVPADHKWVRDAVVAEVLTQTLEGLDLKWPELAPEIKALVIT